jgi:acetate kinase
MLRVLAANAGSSSLKLALFTAAPELERERSVHIAGVGNARSRLTVHDGSGRLIFDERRPIPSHAAAFQAAVESVEALKRVDAVGHRIVRVGREHPPAERITATLLEEFGSIAALDPDHAPQALAVFAEAERACPAAHHFACYDCAFHRTMPAVAQRYPLPRALFDEGVLRLGFHGLSCEYIIERLRSIDPAAAEGRLIVAHLGSGASLTAARGGCSLETTMGFSPTGGMAMSTRSGDLDPSVLLYLQERRHTSAADLRTLVNQQSGLLGVSGSTGDMRELLEREASDARAGDAVALFCYTARKHLGALMTVLEGLETLVFTGGIGEHAAPVRQRICAGLEAFGIVLDAERNARADSIISSERSRAVVRVMATDEEAMIAAHVRRLIAPDGVDDVSL